MWHLTSAMSSCRWIDSVDEFSIISDIEDNRIKDFYIQIKLSHLTIRQQTMLL